MTYVIAQITDVHISDSRPQSAGSLRAAVASVNAMNRCPDLVLVTGDLTENALDAEYDELCSILDGLEMPWEAIRGNHDRRLNRLVGHRTINAGPLHVILMDSADERFTDDDAQWLDTELGALDGPVVIAIHHPPFETGVWWMDCIGLDGQGRFEAVVRRHPNVAKVLSGHVHRTIQTSWGPTPLWVGPSTAVQNAPDLAVADAPAITGEPAGFSVHLWNGSAFVSHVVALGDAGERVYLKSLNADTYAEFEQLLSGRQATRASLFS